MNNTEKKVFTRIKKVVERSFGKGSLSGNVVLEDRYHNRGSLSLINHLTMEVKPTKINLSGIVNSDIDIVKDSELLGKSIYWLTNLLKEVDFKFQCVGMFFDDDKMLNVMIKY